MATSQGSEEATARREGSPEGTLSIEEQVAAEKKQALAEPGPSWRTWFLHSALRAYYFLGILIVDAQIVSSISILLPLRKNL